MYLNYRAYTCVRTYIYAIRTYIRSLVSYVQALAKDMHACFNFESS